jgi:hypothetical protein
VTMLMIQKRGFWNGQMITGVGARSHGDEI